VAQNDQAKNEDVVAKTARELELGISCKNVDVSHFPLTYGSMSQCDSSISSDIVRVNLDSLC
jgi:hypothetical protein